MHAIKLTEHARVTRKHELRMKLHDRSVALSFKLKPHLKRRWLEELRSGLYAQGRYALCDRHNRYCCLGVYVEAEEKRTWTQNAEFGSWHVDVNRDEQFLPSTAMPREIQECLATANDAGLPFSDIADVIEECL